MRGQFQLTFAAGVGFAAVAAIGASAANPEPAPAAPLVSESAAQLRTLKPQSATGRDEIGQGKLRDALPTFEPANPQSPPPSAPPRRPETDNRNAPTTPGAGENWLLDGYANAGKKGSMRSDREGSVSERDRSLQSTADRRTPPAGDQTDALKRTMAGAQQGPANATEATLAPLMRQWLAGSPVKDIALEAWRGGKAPAPGRGLNDGLRLPGEGASLDRFGGERTTTSTTSEPLDIPGAVGSASRRNPYLEALAAPGGGPVRSPVAPAAAGSGLAPIPAPSSVASAASALAPNPQADDKLRAKPAPPPSPEDDKKYFRQLKRF